MTHLVVWQIVFCAVHGSQRVHLAQTARCLYTVPALRASHLFKTSPYTPLSRTYTFQFYATTSCHCRAPSSKETIIYAPAAIFLCAMSGAPRLEARRPISGLAVNQAFARHRPGTSREHPIYAASLFAWQTVRVVSYIVCHLSIYFLPNPSC